MIRRRIVKTQNHSGKFVDRSMACSAMALQRCTRKIAVLLREILAGDVLSLRGDTEARARISE